jgi:hypothetical protein
MPLRLSWRISHIKNAISGSTKTAQNISEGIFISPLPHKGNLNCLFINYKPFQFPFRVYIGILASGAICCPANSPFKYL